MAMADSPSARGKCHVSVIMWAQVRKKRAGQGRAGQGRAGQGRAGQGRAGQGIPARK